MKADKNYELTNPSELEQPNKTQNYQKIVKSSKNTSNILKSSIIIKNKSSKPFGLKTTTSSAIK